MFSLERRREYLTSRFTLEHRHGLVCRAISDDGQFVAVKIYDNAKIEKQNMTEDVAKELGVMIKLNRHHTQHVLRPPGHRNVLAILGYVWFKSIEMFLYTLSD